MFSGKHKNAEPAQRKGRSILGMLFNPEIGASIRPIGETTSMFVKMLAQIFAMNGLIPKDHPALLDTPGVKLNLSHIFSIAWNNLSFTREGAPKVALFLAVTGTLIFSALTAFTIFLLMFLGKAHAATTNFFTPPSPTTDLATSWIGFLFKGTPLADYAMKDASGNTISFAQPTAVQDALIYALAFYSNAILIFAGFILFYHLVSMVVETAHHGVPMGKRANQIWAPIRLVVAIGLLVPVSTNGLNCGQYIAIQMATWGSGLASNVWQVFVEKFVNTSFAPPPSPYVRDLAEKIVLINACILINNADAPPGYPDQQINPNGIPIQGTFPTDTGLEFRPTYFPEGGNTCGQYILHNPSAPAGSLAASVQSDVMKAQNEALQAAMTSAQGALSTLFNQTPPYFIGSNPQLPPAWQDIVGPIADSYQSTLATRLSAALGDLQPKGAQDISDWTNLGWLGAGARFNYIAAMQGSVESIVQASVPTISAPRIADAGSWERVDKALNMFRTWNKEKTQFGSTSPTYAPPSATCDPSHSAAISKIIGSIGGNLEQDIESVKHSALYQSVATEFDTGNHSIINVLARFADAVAGLNCVWSPMNSASNDTWTTGNSFQLGLVINSVDPFAEMVRLGHGNLDTAYTLLDIAVLDEVGGGAIKGVGAALGGAFKGLGGVVGGSATMIGTILGFIALVFFVAGFTLAYFLPLLPFITFFLNSITWVLQVLESVIMMPLVALAHLNPEGDGLPGQNAKNAYFFLFGILLRPALMIFGLICAMLLFTTAVVFMNKMYGIAVTGSLDIGGDSHIFVSHLVYSAMYVVVLYIVCTKSFKCIGIIPDHAMSWMGAASAPKEPIGQAEELGGMVSLISGYAGQQIFPQITQKAQGAGAALAKMGSDYRTDRQAAAAALATGRHRALVEAAGRGGAHPPAVTPRPATPPAAPPAATPPARPSTLPPPAPPTTGGGGGAGPAGTP